jgi:hypothetical protein
MSMPQQDLERLGIQIASDVAREAELRVILTVKRHWLFGAWPLLLAMYPGIFVLVANDLAFPIRIPIAVAVSAAFGLAIDYHRLRKKYKAAIELLQIRERRE